MTANAFPAGAPMQPALPASAPSLLAAAVLAVALPALLAFNLPPSATLLNQCLAVALWGGFAMLLAPGGRRMGSATGPQALVWPLHAAVAGLSLAVLGSWALGSLPFSLAMASLGMLLSAGVMVGAGAEAAQRSDAARLWAMVAAGLLAAGVLSSVVALVQVFAPGWTDGSLIAHSGLVGRAVGNLRQPNHLCSLLLWALVAAVSLHELRRLPGNWLWPLLVLLVFAVELSASRTGAIGLLLLPLWAWADRSLSPRARRALVAAPLLYLLAYGAMAAYGQWAQQAIGAGARLAHAASEADSPNSRLNIWRNALALIAQQPLSGVGWGEFNLAWTLTPFPGRPTAFFDHTHNLPLELAVELGLPAALVVMGLLALALARAWRRSLAASDDTGRAARAALAVVLMIGLHSLVEYPLWYSYFLLPAAFAWGFALAVPTQPSSAGVAAAGIRWGAVAGLVMAMGGTAALLDYRQLAQIYRPAEGNAASLEERIARGQLSPLFAHHADYAAATTDGMPEAMRKLGLLRAPHNLLDTRLMMAWARDLAASGRLDEASALAERLREFRNADAERLFAACGEAAASAAASPAAFACQRASAPHPWRSYALPQAWPPAQAEGPLQPASATQ